ncbi:MAG: hypothetical protein JNL94_13010 [Planctomycetes bacterium]|nr:hypothetical protein [Planctomycetota bacterium]
MQTSIPRILSGLVLGLVLPGLGHVLYRRTDKALYFGVLVIAAFVVGLWLGDWRVVSSVRFPLYLLAQCWLGLPVLIALQATSSLKITTDIAYLDAGLLYTCVAGLLNLVVLVDLYEIHVKTAAAAAKPVGASA